LQKKNYLHSQPALHSVYDVSMYIWSYCSFNCSFLEPFTQDNEKKMSQKMWWMQMISLPWGKRCLYIKCLWMLSCEILLKLIKNQVNLIFNSGPKFYCLSSAKRKDIEWNHQEKKFTHLPFDTWSCPKISYTAQEPEMNSKANPNSKMWTWAE
jgi:hypothetical protein